MSDDSEILLEISSAARIRHLLAVGQVRRAKEMAIQQVEAEPSDPSSYLGLARVLLAEGDAHGAASACEEVIRRAPEWAEGWYLHGLASFRMGRFAEAERDVIEAIRLTPAEGYLFGLYARILSFCGKNAEALDLARRALELDPDDEESHRLFARLLHEVKPSRWKISEELARRAVELNPEDDDGFAVLGSILLTQRRYDEAEQCFRSALELHPSNRLALEGLAQVVMRRNVLYRPFLWYALAMGRLGIAAQLMVIGSLWAVISVVRIVCAPPIPDVATIVYLAICAYTWFAEPVTRTILRRRYHWL